MLSIGLFQNLWGTERNVSCKVLEPSGLLPDWEALELRHSSEIYSRTEFGRLTSRSSWTVIKTVWSRLIGHFRVHTQHQTLYIYIPKHSWAWPLPKSLSDITRPRPNGAVAKSIRYTVSKSIGRTTSGQVSYLDIGLPSQNSSPLSWTLPMLHNLLPGSQSSHIGTLGHG